MENNFKKKIFIANFISFLPLGVFIGLIFNLSKQVYYDTISKFTNLLLITFLISLILSEILKKIFFKKIKGSERPIGAKGCDFFSIGPDVSGKPGFPSGHMSVTSALCTMNILFLIKNKSIFIKTTGIMLNILLIFIMGWARHIKKCHNLLQIGGGTILGSSISLLLFFF